MVQSTIHDFAQNKVCCHWVSHLFRAE